MRPFTRVLRDAALAASGLAALFLPPAARAADKLKFIADWTAEAEHGCFYQAKAAGIYAAHGLDVDILPGGPQVNGPQMLAAGAVDVAIISSAMQAISFSKSHIPIVIVAAIMQKNEQILMAHKSAGYRSLADMKGHPVMISAFARDSYWPWLEGKYGFTDDMIRPYTFNLAPFLHDKAAIQQGYITSEPFAAMQAGAHPQVFLLSDDGYADYGSLLGVRTAWARDHRDEVQRFVDASIEGCYAFLDGDPAKAFALIKQDNPDMTDAQMTYTRDTMKRYGILDSGDAKTLGIGAMTDARWKEIWDLMVRTKISQPGEDYRAVYVTGFVDRKVGMH
jgi:NitT/TauT family transport system substrate-binding protein